MTALRISFRYKIQLAVLFILFLVLASYIGLASRTLLSERIASLMEINSAGTEIVSSRISRKLVANQFWVDSLAASDEASFNANASKNEFLFSLLRKRNNQFERLFDRDLEVAKINAPSGSKSGLFIGPFENQKFFWMNKVLENGDSLHSLWSKDVFQEEQRHFSDGIFFLFNQSSKQVLNFRESAGSQALADQIREMDLLKTLSSTRLKVGEEQFILSSIPVEGFQTMALLATPESVALESVRTLQIRSIYFAILVIGLTGLLSLWIGKALTQKLLQLTGETQKIAQGDLNSARPIPSNDEIGDLSKSIVSMAKDLKKYIQEVSEKMRMESELKTARTVQEMLFPEHSWSNEQFGIQGYYQSASECGGDFWFYWKKENFLFFILADATGHGAPAALITSAARSILAGVEYTGEIRIDKIAGLLHNSVKESSKGKILMTAWMGRIDLSSGDCEYINCSHEPPFVIHPSGQMDLLQTDINPRIGDPSAPSSDFKIGRFKLEKDQRLCVYTDGLSDIQDSEGKVLGDRKLATLMAKNLASPTPLKEAISQFIGFILERSEGRPLEDDVTMLVLERKS